MPREEIDKALIRELADLLDETALTEIEIETSKGRVRVARHQAAVPVSQPAPSVAPPVLEGDGARPVTGEAALPAGTITSPMVGTIYLAPEPGSPPFVSLGDRVEAGQTVLIVEAMKTMNAIPTPHAGTVVEILVADGQPVEFGQPLLVIQ